MTDARRAARGTLAGMHEDEMLSDIRRMVEDEHALRRGLAQSSEPEAARQRLRDLEVSLDRCWDLLRQRRARIEFHQDPEGTRLRSADTVENYWA